MATARTFEDLDAWKKARELTRHVYTHTKKAPFSKDFGLRDQIRRASTSIMSNIAEGFERGGRVEFLQFLSVAKASAGEVRSQLYVARDQDYLDETSFERLIAAAKETSRLISGLMRYLQKSHLRGSKYKNERE